jgi:hypothetical protein
MYIHPHRSHISKEDKKENKATATEAEQKTD